MEEGSSADFSFRAECQADVDQLIQVLERAGISSSIQVKRDAEFPDVEVELQSDATLETIRSMTREVEDGHVHVMVQTLRACRLAENTLERDDNL